jgi:hypothetical protein
MKKLIQGIALLIILSLGFFSCKTASVMKRHYNKGYYVSKKHEAQDVKTTEKVAYTKPAQPIGEPLPPTKTKLPDPVRDVALKNDPIAKKENKESSAKNKIKPATIASSFNQPKEHPAVFNAMPRELKNVLTKDDVARDALSLVWIVIVVLLIVYILGLFLDLFGIGPIFHVLAAIILVLLILWLLRII